MSVGHAQLKNLPFIHSHVDGGRYEANGSTTVQDKTFYPLKLGPQNTTENHKTHLNVS